MTDLFELAERQAQRDDRVPEGYQRLSAVEDAAGLPVRIDYLAHPETHAFPASLEVVLRVGRETATFDAVSDHGRAAVADLIASLSALLDFGDVPAETDTDGVVDVELTAAAHLALAEPAGESLDDAAERE